MNKTQKSPILWETDRQYKTPGRGRRREGAMAVEGKHSVRDPCAGTVLDLVCSVVT